MYLTDTHCHLDLPRFNEDRAAVFERAEQAGIARILIPGIDAASSQAALELADKYDYVFAAVGVHPNHGETWQEGTLTQLRELAEHPKAVAIGEIGLDYYWDKTPKDLQDHMLGSQLDLARELGYPVVIHNREATADVLNRLLAWQDELAKDDLALAERPGVLHSFSGNVEEAKQAIEANFYIGFTGPITFKNAPEVREIAAALPLDRILIETDAPYLTPHPHRGQRNEPAYVRFVAEKIAEIHAVPVEQVMEATFHNAATLFEW